LLIISRAREVCKKNIFILKLRSYNFSLIKARASKIISFKGIHLDSHFLNCSRLLNVQSLCRKELQFENNTLSFARAQLHDFLLLVVSGPYTNVNNLDYEPLEDFLLGPVVSICPSFVLMVGPFVSEDHSMISTEVPSETYEEIFISNFLKSLTTFIRDHIIFSTKFILINSTQ